MKYSLKEIMLRAWRIYREREGLTFAEALHRAWICEKAKPVNAERIEAAKAAANARWQSDKSSSTDANACKRMRSMP